jgi:hypothetical protein
MESMTSRQRRGKTRHKPHNTAEHGILDNRMREHLLNMNTDHQQHSDTLSDIQLDLPSAVQA